MVTRISSNLNLTLMGQNIQRARQAHYNASIPLATGKRINKLSDDPTRISEYFRLQNRLQRRDQYELNMSTAKNRLNMSEVVVTELTELTDQVYELALQGNDPSLSAAEVTAIADRLSDIQSDMLDLANSQMGDTYLFSGFLATTQPFTETGAALPGAQVAFNGDTNNVMVPVSSTKQVQVSINGDDLFTGGSGNTDVFTTIATLIQDIQNRDSTEIGNRLTDLETIRDQFLGAQADIGHSLQQIDTQEGFLNNSQLRDTERLSVIADADLAEATSNLSYAEFTLEAAFAVSSRIMEISLQSFFS